MRLSFTLNTNKAGVVVNTEVENDLLIKALGTQKVNMKVSLSASHLSTEPMSTGKLQFGVTFEFLALEMLDTPRAKFLCTSPKISPFLW